MRYRIWVVCAYALLCLRPPCAAESTAVQWEKFNAGYFSIDKPQGWQVTVTGQCSMFSFIVSDPQYPLRRIFYFGTVGPFFSTSSSVGLITIT